MIEITEGDFEQIRLMMKLLYDCSAAMDGRVTELSIRAVVDGQSIVVGYGENAEPALLIAEVSDAVV